MGVKSDLPLSNLQDLSFLTPDRGYGNHQHLVGWFWFKAWPGKEQIRTDTQGCGAGSEEWAAKTR